MRLRNEGRKEHRGNLRGEGRDTAPIALAAELLRRGRTVEIVAGGGSMWPLVRHGDRLVVDPAPPPRVGDLAAVLRNDHLVIHRVISVGDAGILLHGDNLSGPDPVVTPQEVLGVVTRHVLRTGHVLDHRHGIMRLIDNAAARTIRLGRKPRRVALALAKLRYWSLNRT